MSDRATRSPSASDDAAPGAGQVGAVSRRAARNVALLGILNVASKVGTFVFTLIGARALTRGDFGAFTYALALGSLLAAIPGWGFDRVMVREASNRPREMGTLLAELYTWRTVVGIPVFLGAAAYAALSQESVSLALAFLAVVLALFVDIITTQSAAAAAAVDQNVTGVTVAQLIQRFLTAIMGAAAIVGGLGLLGFAGAFLVSTLIGAWATIVALRRLGIRAKFREMGWFGLAKMGRQSIGLGFDSMLALALLRFDAVLIGVFKGDVAVGSYAVSYRILETALFVVIAVQAVLLPVMSTATESWRMRLGVERGMSIAALFYVPFGVACVLRGHEIIGLIFGARYEDASGHLLQLLALAPLPFAFGAFATSALVSRHFTREAVIGTVVAAVSNIGLNLVLIPELGPKGAAYTTTGCYLLEAVVLLWYFVRRFGWPRVDRAVAECAAAGVAMVATLLVVPRTHVLVDLAVATGVFVAAWVALSARFAPDHLEVIRSFLPKRERADLTAPLTFSERTYVARARARRVVVALAIVGGSVAVGLLLGFAGSTFGPMAVVALPLAIGWVALALSNRIWAVVPVLLAFPLSFDAGSIGPLDVLDVVVLGAIGLTMLQVVARPAAGTRVEPLAVPFALVCGAALCVLGVLSAALAVDSGLAVRHVLAVALALLLAFAVVSTCRGLRDVRLLVGFVLVVGAPMCAVALGSAQNLKSSFGGTVVSDRPTGFFGQPNELGSFAAMILMVALGVALGRYAPRYRIGATVTAVLAAVAMALSLSRGAWIGVVLGLVALVVLRPRIWRALAAIAVVAIVGGAALNVFQPDAPELAVVRARFGTVLDGSDNPYDDRPQIWAEAFREIEERPLLGFGPGNFPVASNRAGTDASVSADHAHNAILTVGSEVGLPAVVLLIAFTLAVGLAVRRTVRACRGTPDASLAAGVGAALMTVVGQGLVDYPLRNGVLMVLAWTLVGIALAMDRISRRSVMPSPGLAPAVPEAQKPIQDLGAGRTFR